MRPCFSGFVLVVAPLLGLGGYSPTLDGPAVSAQRCEQTAACDAGAICIEGSCVRADCDADVCRTDPEACCEAWERCTDERTCTLPDDGPIDAHCEADADGDSDSFCSADRCYVTDAHCPCTRAARCAPDERCDALAARCVPDLGGCQHCEAFPELCCLDGTCDLQTERRAAPEPECTAAADCLAPLRCHPWGLCTACVDDADCGADLVCSRIGTCESNADVLTCLLSEADAGG